MIGLFLWSRCWIFAYFGARHLYPQFELTFVLRFDATFDVCGCSDIQLCITFFANHLIIKFYLEPGHSRLREHNIYMKTCKLAVGSQVKFVYQTKKHNTSILCYIVSAILISSAQRQ